jgi:trans-AT polyketide synthase, acyltransferase and oxidoreductase domains
LSVRTASSEKFPAWKRPGSFYLRLPAKIVAQLKETGKITETEAELSRFVPMADDITAEADSGGHTDNRPAVTLLPSMLALRDECRPVFA